MMVCKLYAFFFNVHILFYKVRIFALFFITFKKIEKWFTYNIYPFKEYNLGVPSIFTRLYTCRYYLILEDFHYPQKEHHNH